VRRRIAGDCAAARWSALIGGAMDALGEAQLLQFQEQLDELDDPAIGALTASAALKWLPPAGFLDATGARRLDWRSFLGAHRPAREVPLDPGDVRGVLAAALRRAPVPVGAATGYRVYRISGSARCLFVRQAANSLHAEEVWFDGTSAALPEAADVQAAIALLRARSCRQVALWPGADLEAIITALPAQADVSLCFEAGDYSLARPLLLRGLGHVRVHGAGAGSRLTATGGECALRIDNCASATVSGLSLRATTTSSGKDESGIGLRGALTVVSTPSVRIEAVHASCGSGVRGSGAAIVVNNPATGSTIRTSVHITACTLSIGRAQLGIVCVNTDLALIRQNLVGSSGKSGESLSRGIVVAGVRASEVRIEDNVVEQANEGIDVGLSKEETAKGEALSADRVVIARNSVTLRVVDAERSRFHGIFVGNANSVVVQANRVLTEDRLVPAAAAAVDGVRLIGVYGRHVVVRDNHFEGARIGIIFDPQQDRRNQLPGPNAEVRDRIWLFACNVAESAEKALVYNEKLINNVTLMAENNIAPAAV